MGGYQMRADGKAPGLKVSVEVMLAQSEEEDFLRRGILGISGLIQHPSTLTVSRASGR